MFLGPAPPGVMPSQDVVPCLKTFDELETKMSSIEWTATRMLWKPQSVGKIRFLFLATKRSLA